MAVGNIDGALGADLIANFRGAGVWTFRNNSVWSQLHALDASLITTGRLDTAAGFPVESDSVNRGLDDVLLAFPGYGLYQYSNNATWTQVHRLSPLRVAVGDFDLDGKDDLTVDFGPGYGLWTLTNGFTWAQLHPSSSNAIAMGDFDGNGQDEIAVDFGAGGIWLQVNARSWLQLSAASQVEFNVVDFH
jgi:hypothetical protein